MTGSTGRFGRTATADQVLDGLDLSGQVILLTGCASGIGLESMRALAARGAHVIGTGRSMARAADACRQVGGHTTPIACDQDDLASVADAARAVRRLGVPLDAIIANAGIMVPPTAAPRYGVESQFRVNHLSHMLLVTRLADLLRDGSGRLVMVSSSAQSLAPKVGIEFDDLGAQRSYRAWPRYGQSKLANVAFALGMADRLRERGITANAIHPGMITSTGLPRSMRGPGRLLLSLAGRFGKSIPQGAATQCYAAAHPDMADRTGGYYADCRPATPNRHALDPAFRQRLWSVSEALLAGHAPAA